MPKILGTSKDLKQPVSKKDAETKGEQMKSRAKESEHEQERPLHTATRR